MVRKGLSGARIRFFKNEVWKIGDGVSQQGDYCNLLGPDVCPIATVMSENSYSMEWLYEPDASLMPGILLTAKHILKKHVWNRKVSYPYTYWKDDLKAFLESKNLCHCLDGLYPDPNIQQVFIHGDPTFANMMFRHSRTERMQRTERIQLVICDPLLPSGKIPGLPEVDIGKLLQSAIGWEICLDMEGDFSIAQSNYHEIVDVLTEHDSEIRRKSFFWCVVHLLRVLKRLRLEDIHMRAWVNEKIENILETEI